MACRRPLFAPDEIAETVGSGVGRSSPDKNLWDHRAVEGLGCPRILRGALESAGLLWTANGFEVQGQEHMGVPISQMWTVASYVLRQKLSGRKRYPLVLMLEPLFPL